jgi:hypothetical protein
MIREVTGGRDAHQHSVWTTITAATASCATKLWMHMNAIT